jgi:alpha-tubulin suppressor-like RCC1 family protein
VSALVQSPLRPTRTSGAAVALALALTLAMLSAGDSHGCGVTPQGRAYCWGDNRSGQLGDGTRTRQLTPVAVAGS